MPLNEQATLWDRLKTYALYLLPHHWLSLLTYHLTRIETPLKDPLIRAYIRFFKVDMREAEALDADDYASFNDFFTRALKPGAREINMASNTLVSPCDGTLTQIGTLRQGSLLQAKGSYYPVDELLGGTDPYARRDGRVFACGKFCTIYLSPRDYHRVHAPVDMRLKAMTRIPGRLFSVANYAVKTIPGLYTRNERVACVFDSNLGEIAVVMVGAFNVGSIDTVWSGQVTPDTLTTTRRSFVDDTPPEISLKRGEELGRFNLGSCVILLVANSEISWKPIFTSGKPVRLGEELACLTSHGAGRSTPAEQTSPTVRGSNPPPQ